MRNISFLCLTFLYTNLLCSDLDQKLARLAETSVSFGNRDQVGAELKACTSSVMEGFVSQKGSEILSQISGANLSGLEVASRLRQLGSEYETSLCEQLRFKDAADFHRRFDAEIPLMAECLVERAEVAGSSTDVFKFTQDEAHQAIGECGGLPLFFRLMGHSEKLAQRLEGQEADSQNIQSHVTESLQDYRESLGMLREFAGTRLLDNAAPVAQCIAGRVPDIKEQRVQQILADKKAQEASEFVDNLHSIEDGSLDRRVAATFLVACRAQGQSNQDCDSVTFEGSNMTMSRITDGVDSTLFTHIDLSENKANVNSSIEHSLGGAYRVARALEVAEPGEVHQLDSNTSCMISKFNNDRLTCMTTDVSNDELSSMRQRLDSSVAARNALFDNPPKTTREWFEHQMLFSGFPHF